MQFSSIARAGSRAFTLGCTLMTGAAMIAFSSPEAYADAGDGNFYFFGDSSTGQGNWSALVGQQGEDHSPYSSNNGFERESNGLIWAEMLGRDVDIILDPDADSSNLNFAISGAHMTRGGDLVAYGVETGVLVQTELFGLMVNSGDIAVGKDDVVFMLAGGNDYLDRLPLDDPAEEIMADVANAAAANVSALADAGIKTIILSEIQPLQYAPQFADEAEVRSALSDLVAQTNAAIIAAVEEAGLPEDVNIVTMKYGAMLAHITENAAALGFSNVTNACFNDDANEICSNDVDVQNEYLFLDDLHFTERAHEIKAQWWMATLAGANGSASRQTARIPRIAYEQLDAHLDHVRPGAYTSEDDSFSAWVAPNRSSMELKADGRDVESGLSYDGVVLGMEGRFAQHFIVGGALSVGDTTAKFVDGGRYKLEGGALSVYGAVDYEKTGRLSLSLTSGGQEINDIKRVTGVELLTAEGGTDTKYWEVDLAARSTDHLGAFSIDHGVSLTAGRIETDGYQESGAEGLALGFDDQSFNYRRLSVDAVVHGPSIAFTDGLRLSPLLDAAYSYQFGDEEFGVTSHLLGNTAQSVTIRSLAPADHRFDIGVGAKLAIDDRWSLTARYAVQWADDISDSDQGSITLRASF